VDPAAARPQQGNNFSPLFSLLARANFRIKKGNDEEATEMTASFAIFKRQFKNHQDASFLSFYSPQHLYDILLSLFIFFGEKRK
jgi:hypothetical protein